MATINHPCIERGCDKSFRKRADLERHLWSHIPKNFRPLCPGTQQGADGVDVLCVYRYNGRRDLWKSHWARHHQQDAYPTNHQFDALGVCRMMYANSLSAPFPVADITNPVNVGNAGTPALTLVSKDFHASPGLRIPVSAGIQTQAPVVGQFGPAVADMSTLFHPSPFPYIAFHGQPGPCVLPIPQRFPHPVPVGDHPGFHPWLTSPEYIQRIWQQMSDAFLDIDIPEFPF